MCKDQLAKSTIANNQRKGEDDDEISDINLIMTETVTALSVCRQSDGTVYFMES